jgi:hypothetical protein
LHIARLLAGRTQESNFQSVFYVIADDAKQSGDRTAAAAEFAEATPQTMSATAAGRRVAEAPCI